MLKVHWPKIAKF